MEHQYDENKNVNKKCRWENRYDGKASAKLLLGLKQSNEIDRSHDRPCLGIHILDIGEEIHDDMSANSLQLGMLGDHSNMSYGLHNRWRNDGLPGVESYMEALECRQFRGEKSERSSFSDLLHSFLEVKTYQQTIHLRIVESLSRSPRHGTRCRRICGGSGGRPCFCDGQ